MTARHATSGVALTTTVVAGRYLRDLNGARARLTRLERPSTPTPSRGCAPTRTVRMLPFTQRGREE